MVDYEYLFKDQTVAASENATSVDTLDCHNYNKINVYVYNAGTSANCAVIIKGSSHSSKDMEGEIQSFVLGAGGKAKIGIDHDNIPEYIWATVKNGDPLNSAIITVELAMDR